MQLYYRERYLKRIRGFYDAEDIIKVITGVRRCGKSSLMQMVAEELRARGVAEENILYLDLDRREYRHVDHADALDALIQEKSTAPGRKYLFIDEIQNVPGFELIINGYRTEGGYSIFITGSNSYLLSGEIATKLTGRYIEFELLPLTFDEYEAMKEFYHITRQASAMAEMNSYIMEGGFPRAVLIEDLADKRKYAASVVEEIFAPPLRQKLSLLAAGAGGAAALCLRSLCRLSSVAAGFDSWLCRAHARQLGRCAGAGRCIYLLRLLRAHAFFGLRALAGAFAAGTDGLHHAGPSVQRPLLAAL